MTLSATQARPPATVPGGGLLHPIALAAVVALVANDHLWKGVGPAPVTGILSGVAGLVLTPLVLVAGFELLSAVMGRSHRPSARLLLVACAATGIGYAAVEIVPTATEAYRYGWGVLQWPGSAIAAWIGGNSLPAPTPVQAVADPLDLFALPALWLAWRAGRARTAIRPASPRQPARRRTALRRRTASWFSRC